jgi:hypothetical protein
MTKATRKAHIYSRQLRREILEAAREAHRRGDRDLARHLFAEVDISYTPDAT